MVPLLPVTQDLDHLAAIGRLRRLAPRKGLDFASNDYLGLAGDPRLADAARRALDRGVPLGSGGSRLLRGNHPEHEALEREAAAFFGAETALLFGSGYAANSALLATLPQRDDLIVHDALVHASAHEGMRLSRAPRVEAAHDDLAAFEAAIRDWRMAGGTGRPWFAVESLYSMDGDLAPIDALLALAEREGGFLLVDEAHATGVFGPNGRGLAAAFQGRPNLVTLHTLGKSLGCEGAIVCCAEPVRDLLVNRARGFIYSTAPSPLMAAVAREALRVVADADRERLRLAALIRRAGEKLARHGATPTGTPIMPLVLGDDARAMSVAASLAARGLDVRGVRPPSVLPGTARLRLSITLNVDEEAIDMLDSALAEALA